MHMHIFCAGEDFIPPCFDGSDGKEFSCAKCTGGIYLELCKSPSSRRVTQEEEKGKWNVLLLIVITIFTLNRKDH